MCHRQIYADLPKKEETAEKNDKGNLSSRTGKLNSGAERSAVRAVRNKRLRRTSYTFR
jgi:hypothetical protein